MKNLFYCILLIAFSGIDLNAQFPAGFGWVFPRESPPAGVSQTVGVTDITIKYHRPTVGERVIWGCQTDDVIQRPGAVYPCLVPNGQVWRAGANEATTISFSTDVSVEGQPLPAGTYGLFMIPGQTEWTIIFSKRPNQWGSFTYNQADDALRIKTASRSAEHQERLEYSFPAVSNNTAQIALRWEKVKVPFNVEIDTAKQASARAMSRFDPASGYFAANYYYQNKINLDEALKWINAALAFQENGSNFMLKARILAELKRYDEAIETAGKAVKLFRERNLTRPVEEAEKLIDEWNKSKLNSQKEEPAIPVDSLFQLIKTRSVHRKLIQWDNVEPKFRERLNKAKSDDEILKSFVWLFSQMNDVHSAIYYKNKYYGHYKEVDEETAQSLRPLLDLEQAHSGKIKTSVIANKYGYVLVPTIQALGSDQINQSAQIIQDKICSIGVSNPKGWVIDLRLNGGGNMYPMLAGLNNFLGDKIIGGFVDADDKLGSRWSLKGGDVFINEEKATSIKNRCKAKYEQTPTVILISPITRSSGEATAIAFKHRPNTYFIGESTAGGYTTANAWISINQDLVLNLSTSYMADRKGTPYKIQVLPDLRLIDKDSFNNLAEDQKVNAAIAWLNKKTGFR